MRTTIKKTYIRGGGSGGPIYYVPVRKDHVVINISLIQETVTDSFDGGTNIFTLSKEAKDQNIFVYFNGVLQEPSTYIINGKILILNAIVPVGWKIDVVYTSNK